MKVLSHNVLRPQFFSVMVNHSLVTNFLVELTNFHVILTEECGYAPVFTV